LGIVLAVVAHMAGLPTWQITLALAAGLGTGILIFVRARRRARFEALLKLQVDPAPTRVEDARFRQKPISDLSSRLFRN
jgi:hypothetical protein